MRKLLNKFIPTLLLTFILLCNVYAQDSLSSDTAINDAADVVLDKPEVKETKKQKPLKEKQLVYLFKIHQEIDPAATRITEKAIEAAEEMEADYLLLDLNTYGGLVSDADNIRTALLNTDIPTMVFIRNNAASAGALISIACDSIYMKNGATIGAAAVVYDDGSYAPEKYQSYMRQKMRATAEATNRDPDIAEGMVSESMVIEGLSDSTEIITLTVSEAIQYGYCNAEADSPEDALSIAGIDSYELVEHKISATERIIALLVKPAVSGILLMFLVGGIYFELKTPGIGFPLLVAVIAAILYFSPLYLEGLAANWEIALFVVGLILIALEVFVIPGFGVAGVLGIIATIGSLALAMVKNIDYFDFGFVAPEKLTFSFLMVSTVLVAGLIIILFGSQKIGDSKAIKRLSLETSLAGGTADTKVTTQSLKSLIGKKGLVVSELRPAGKVEIEDEYLEAQSDGEYIEKGQEIIVDGVRGAYLLVRKA